ncbi:MAG: hypothetical protein KH366_19220 [Clostridiaceae bacterium]|nr:hypothetical protein [Clostridiaceae bacterium]
MTEREKLLMCLKRQDRIHIPFDIGFNPEANRHFKKELQGKCEREYFQCPSRSVYPDFLEARQPFDSRMLYPGGIPKGAYVDEWGICTTERKGLVHVINPMKDFEDVKQLDHYPFPDYSNPACYSKLKGQVAQIHSQGLAAIVKAERMIFAMGRDLRGYENHLMDYCINQEFNEALLDRILKCQKELIRGMAQSGADIIWLSSDVASQTNVFLRPEMYHETIGWRMRQLYQTAREVNPDILCAYHCCGNVVPIMEDIMDFGIDILNPIQPESLDFETFKRDYGDRLVLWGGISVQHTLPFGTQEEVRREVHRVHTVLGEGGGLVISPCNEITEDIPWENMEALAAEAHKYWQ